MKLRTLGRLDSSTRSKLRSTQILTSLPQIVSELVQNSLDAGAKNIDIGIHCEDWECWVRDDGSGINKKCLALIAQGIEGGRYSSSKSYNLDSLNRLRSFGFRGEALASAADLSCLEISSRTSRSKESWTVILKGGENIYQGSSLRWRRERAGTVVVIRDAFYNMPVRRRSHPSSSRTLELVQRDLESFALVFPNVAFSLEDISRGSRGDAGTGTRILSIPKESRTGSTVATFRCLFGKALVEHVEKVDACSSSVRIEGFLSLVGSPSKSYQYFYVNNHILEYCHLHRLIDKKFGSSLFSRQAYDESGERQIAMRGSAKKGERKPVYVLNLIVSTEEVDNCLDPNKSVIQLQNHDAIESFLSRIIDDFLKKHRFSSPRSPVLPLSERAKRKRDGGLDDRDREMPLRKNRSSVKRNETRQLYIPESPGPNNDEEIIWHDPSNGKQYSVDPRTGNSSIISLREQEGITNSQSTKRRTLVDTRFLRPASSVNDYGHCCDTEPKDMEAPAWIRKALEFNRAFESTEAAIPRVPAVFPNDETGNCYDQHPWLSQTELSSTALLRGHSEFRGYPKCVFTKKCLEGARVIEQVDCKFIACLMNVEFLENVSNEAASNSNNVYGCTTLVLVDQHAADERIRVERFLKELCLEYLDRNGEGVDRRLLDPVVPVLLARSECFRLKGASRLKGVLREWGFNISEVRSEPGEESNDKDYGMVYFESVPEIIADKLLAGNAEALQEFAKSCLGRLDAEDVGARTRPGEEGLRLDRMSPSDGDEFAWLKALRCCPRSLVELVNSKACRGAIMFNDRLHVERCNRLVRQLAQTAFPFQCAHGRPSVVPLMSLQQCISDQNERRNIDWTNLLS